ncbi:MAG: ABC transporter ATP-binding protein [Sneathiella sp.]|nr:MAG: ABC transporter ATP-binding protein [Sneathiella sp.]
MNVPELLSAQKISGGYGDTIIVRGISMSLAGGDVLCVTGRNGVGKSTLLKLIAGVLQQSDGVIKLAGTELRGPAFVRQRQGLGYMPQVGVVFDNLSVQENLTLQYKGRSLKRYEALFASFPRMAERLTQKAGTLSGGEKKILSFCRVIAETNKLAILDEPSEGVQPENIALMAEHILAEKKNGRSFIVAEQNTTLIEQIHDHVLIMDHGEVMYEFSCDKNIREIINKHISL